MAAEAAEEEAQGRATKRVKNGGEQQEEKEKEEQCGTPLLAEDEQQLQRGAVRVTQFHRPTSFVLCPDADAAVPLVW